MKTTFTEQATIDEFFDRNKSRKASIKFPLNDYLVNGRVKTYSPIVSRSISKDEHGVYVRFDKLKWDITEVEALCLQHEDGSIFKHYQVKAIKARY